MGESGCDEVEIDKGSSRNSIGRVEEERLSLFFGNEHGDGVDSPDQQETQLTIKIEDMEILGPCQRNLGGHVGYGERTR